MQLTYDPRYNIAYLRLKETEIQVETIKISDSVNLDLAPDGTLYGIELLNANEQIGRLKYGEFAVLNEASGKRVVVSLP